MIKFLCDYLSINTAHPNPDYASAIALFKNQALEDGFLTQEFTLPSGNSVLVITLAGSDPSLSAVALNHHMDVVPAENVHEWMHPPFQGTMHDGFIYGRGTQDMKAVGIAHYAALKSIKAHNNTLARTVHLLIVPDEERGGFLGTKEFIEHPDFRSLNIGFFVDEGIPSGNDDTLLIKTEERTPIQMKITAQGPMGHASQLAHFNAGHALVQFLSEVVNFHEKQKARSIPENAGSFFSCHVTSLSSNSTALNVIPSHAQATIDFRVPAQHTIQDAMALFKDLIKKHPHISFEVLATSVERFAPIDQSAALYKSILHAILENGFNAQPFAFEATTDSRFYSHKGIPGIGLTPFSIQPNLHGTNECISIKDFEQAQKIFVSFLKHFCTHYDR